MKLLWTWQYGHWLYQVWDTEHAYIMQCIDLRTLETIFEVDGNTPTEALEAGVMEAFRCLSPQAREDIEP